MINSCSCCCKVKNIFWNDYCWASKSSPAIKINLCWDCLKFLGWNKELARLKPKVFKCLDCGDMFIPKKKFHRCSVCWLKFFGKLKKESKEKQPVSITLDNFVEVQCNK